MSSFGDFVLKVFYSKDPMRCPVCGKRPLVKYRSKWHCWEVLCRPSIFDEAHFVFTGKPEESKRDTIRHYNESRR